MATELKRFTLTVDKDIERQVEELKKTEYYGVPYAVIYRTLIAKGLEN